MAGSLACRAVAGPTLLISPTPVTNTQSVLVGRPAEELSWQTPVPAPGCLEDTAPFAGAPAYFRTTSKELPGTGRTKASDVLLLAFVAKQPAVYVTTVESGATSHVIDQGPQGTSPYVFSNSGGLSPAGAVLKFFMSFKDMIYGATQYQIKLKLLAELSAVIIAVGKIISIKYVVAVQNKAEVLQVQGILHTDAQHFQFDPGQATAVCIRIVS